ncbi:MFS transporter [Rhizorhabdus sp. FW153]|uniref:MFS transporter n=1 Tax=Rhizorhabdus sp. FW153 TaxID=3400216 RepID=UPI003CF27F3C
MRGTDLNYGRTRPYGPGQRVSRTALAAFTLPVVTFQAIEMTWRSYLPRFLEQDVGIALGSIAALMLCVRLFDAAADPLIGWMSDSCRTRFGRRKPWMISGALLVSLAVLPLYLAPSGAGMAWIVGASLLFHLGYSLIITPHGGWGLELSVDSHQRTRIMGAKVWFAIAGSLALLAFLSILERRFATPLRVEMALFGWAIALLAPLTVIVPILLFAEPEPERIPTVGRAGLLEQFRDIIGNRTLALVLLLYTLTGIADAAAMTCFLFLAEDVFGLDRWGASLLLIQPVAALLALPFWSRLSARLGRPATLVLSYSWQAAACCALLLVPAGAPFLLGAVLTAKGLGWGVDYMLLRAMVADIASDCRFPSAGAASHYAVSSITLKIAMGLGSGGALWAISLGSGAERLALIQAAFVLPSVLAAAAAWSLLCRRAPIGRMAVLA